MTEPAALPILLDCDPGNDDALGILVAAGHPGLDLRAVTTGAGHLAADRTARNGAIALHLTGRTEIPVSAGAAGPLVRERLIAGILDMDSALDPDRPDFPARPLYPRPSSELIVQTVLSGAATTIVTTGPLTNLALALRQAPQIATALDRIVMLGGSWGLGNKTAAAEWNILCDPEAAHVVLEAGIPVTMLPIDALTPVGIGPEMIERARAIKGPVGAFATELLESLVTTFRPGGVLAPDYMPLNDPVASLVAADASLAQTHPARVDVELAGRHTYGRTVVDFALRNSASANVDVVTRLDRDRVLDAFIDALTGLARSLK